MRLKDNSMPAIRISKVIVFIMIGSLSKLALFASVPTHFSHLIHTKRCSTAHYQSIRIEKPPKNTVWNQHQILVKVKVWPKLSKRDLIHVLLDGMVVATLKKPLCFYLSDIPPGEHPLAAQIVRARRVIKTSQTKILYIHYTTSKEKMNEN